jgi:cobalamin biosynthesis Mg chelatase CobN
MAEMRLPAQASALLAGLLLLTLPALASAEIKPVPRPDKTIAPIQPTKTSTAPVQQSSPPPPPAASTTSSSTTSGSTTSGSTTSGSATSGSTTTPPADTTPPPETVIVVTAQGGRDQSGIAVPAPPPPEPTPLGTVAAGDRVTSPGTSTPAWKIALLALLAAAEAFLVVRLVRNRPSGDLSPAS